MEGRVALDEAYSQLAVIERSQPAVIDGLLSLFVTPRVDGLEVRGPARGQVAEYDAD